MLIDLGLIWLIGWMLKNAVEDVTHAVKGTTNPRYELKKQKAIAAGKAAPRQPRYGGREWFADLLSDGLAAQTEHRRAKAKAKAAPVDDMVDVVRERHPHDPNNTRNCPVCKGEVALDGRPCPRCLSEQARRNAEWERQHDRHETPEPAPPVPEPEPERQPAGRNPHVDYADQRFICDGCGQERYPAGRKEIAGQGALCLYCQRYGAEEVRAMRPDPRPDAQIIQFPNPKHIEKEITMSNEATGLATAIAFADQAATAHTSFATTGAEGYVGALERGGMGDGPVGTAKEAMEASGIAAEKWAAHKAKLEEQLRLREAYQSQPDAADKDYLLAE